MKDKEIFIIEEFFTKLLTYSKRDNIVTKKILNKQLNLVQLIVNIAASHPEFIVDGMPIVEFITHESNMMNNYCEDAIENYQNIITLLDEYYKQIEAMK